MGALTFYFDRCFGKRFPQALETLEPPFAVEYHHSRKNRFPQNIEDDDWLNRVGPKGWVVFTHDRRLHDQSPCIEAMKQHGIGCFYLWGANDTTWEKMRYFIRRYDRIHDLVHATRRPFIFHVGLHGQIKRVPIS